MTDAREADRRHVWHPYTQHALLGEVPEIARAEGAYLFEKSGRPVLDMISSWWVTLHGHANPAIALAIADQAARMDQVMFTSFTHEPAALFSSELCDRLPAGLERVFFSDDGSTAVEAALKMALQYWANAGENRKTIVALEGAYHGDTFGAMSASARSAFTAPFDSHLKEVVRLPLDSGTLEGFEALLAARSREIAALIVEPMLQGAGGMRVWRAELLKSLAKRARETGVLLIADEVLTGFGRTGPLFACEHAGITPDIICLSKGITGGFLPLGATVATREVFDRFSHPDRSRTFFHGHSYTANPIACAAARASLRQLDDSSFQRRQLIEQTHRDQMAALATHASVRNPRVIGTVAAFDITGESTYMNPVGMQLGNFALERGVLLRPLGNVVYLLPPYCTTPDQLGQAYAVLKDFLDQL